MAHIGDILAIPFFGLLVYYFYHIPFKTQLENVLFAFCVAGLILDILFSCLFFTRTLRTKYKQK